MSDGFKRKDNDGGEYVEGKVVVVHRVEMEVYDLSKRSAGDIVEYGLGHHDAKTNGQHKN